MISSLEKLDIENLLILGMLTKDKRKSKRIMRLLIKRGVRPAKNGFTWYENRFKNEKLK